MLQKAKSEQAESAEWLAGEEQPNPGPIPSLIIFATLKSSIMLQCIMHPVHNLNQPSK